MLHFPCSACWWGEFIFMWVPENQRFNWRISHSYHFLWWWNHQQTVPFPHSKMGCWWRCWQETLGMQACANKTFRQLILKCTFWNLQSKFLSFYQYAKTFNSDTFDYDAMQETDYVFMRWIYYKLTWSSLLY